MELHIIDRIYIPAILPAESSFMDFNLKREITKKVALTEADAEKHKIKEDVENKRTTWDPAIDRDNVTDYAYELKETEYVVFDGRVWYPTMSPVADTLKEGYNFRYHDPRNPNIKKHMIKIALFELHKLISPNNVSTARITDYEATMQWLHDANRLKSILRSRASWMRKRNRSVKSRWRHSSATMTHTKIRGRFSATARNNPDKVRIPACGWDSFLLNHIIDKSKA